MTDCFDITYSTRHYIKEFIGYRFLINLLADLESQFNVIVNFNTTTEKRLMIKIKVTRKAFESNKISDSEWIRLDENIIEGLTKLGRCKALEKLVKTGVLTTKVEQWINHKEGKTTDRGSGYIKGTSLINREHGLRI